MKFSPIIFILIAGLVSCSEKKDDDRLTQNYLEGKFILNDTVSRRFNLWGCFCNIKGNSVQITNTSGVGFTGEELVTVVANGDTTFAFETWSDVGQAPKFTINNHFIEIRESDLGLGDSLKGKIYVKGVFVESQQDRMFEISGHFKCKLQDSTYTFESYQHDLLEQYDSLRLIGLKKISYINPDSIIELEFRYDNFHLIENEIVRFKNLEKLSLVGFPHVKAELISSFKSLRDLTIKGDSLKEIPLSIGQSAKLERLSFTGPIAKLPDNIYNLTNLKELDLGATNVAVISTQIKKLTNLEVLNIGYTNIIHIPMEIFDLEKLSDLTLPDTIELFKIKDLNLKSLKTLHAPYELLFYNRSDIEKLCGLEWLYPSFVYKTHEEYMAKHGDKLQWLEERLPGVSISEITYVND
jgi:hypothetical protein